MLVGCCWCWDCDDVGVAAVAAAGTGDDGNACVLDPVSRDERRQPTSLDSEPDFSASSSISLFAIASLRFDSASVSCVSRSAVV
jgi:hypothetical protein